MTQAWDFVDATVLWQAGNSILDEDPTEIFEVSARVYNVLRNLEIKTVRELIARRPWELMRNPNFGRKSLVEIETVLHAHGLNLRAEDA
jgi:DNA-directed RNA polymerase subunit alpha